MQKTQLGARGFLIAAVTIHFSLSNPAYGIRCLGKLWSLGWFRNRIELKSYDWEEALLIVTRYVEETVGSETSARVNFIRLAMGTTHSKVELRVRVSKTTNTEFAKALCHEWNIHGQLNSMVSRLENFRGRRPPMPTPLELEQQHAEQLASLSARLRHAEVPSQLPAALNIELLDFITLHIGHESNVRRNYLAQALGSIPKELESKLHDSCMQFAAAIMEYYSDNPIGLIGLLELLK